MARSSARRPRRPGYAKHLVIMAKSPVAGRVKRRLGREIGDIPAIRFYRHCLSHTALRLAQDKRWRTLLAIDPDRDVEARLRAFAAKTRAREARARATSVSACGACSRRCRRAQRSSSAATSRRSTPSTSRKPSALLGRNDAVFGPAPDGGYWLIGFKRTPKALAPFAGVRWSSPHALADTLANLKSKRVAFAVTLSDVDGKDDYRRDARPSAERRPCV